MGKPKSTAEEISRGLNLPPCTVRTNLMKLNRFRQVTRKLVQKKSYKRKKGYSVYVYTAVISKEMREKKIV
jgi:predicted transcriptional regulator